MSENQGDRGEFLEIVGRARRFREARIVLTAVELDLFSVLSSQSLRAEELAERLDAEVRGVTILCNALVALGLLVRSEDRYAASDAARRYLDRDSDEYRGSYLHHWNHLWDRWSRLTEVVRAGADAIGPEWGASQKRDFVLAMHARKDGAGDSLVGQLDLHGVERAIDLGGGSGTFAEALARAVPECQVVLVDRPEAIEIARTRLPEELLADRIVTIERDFMEEGVPLAGTPPAPYDLALLSMVLHSYPPSENSRLLGRVFEALEPGGQVVIREFVLDEGLTSPAEAALFGVNMLVNTEAGRAYSFEEMKGWLHEAGFGQVERLPLEGAVELIVARRA